jgi:hypothetical protein
MNLTNEKGRPDYSGQPYTRFFPLVCYRWGLLSQTWLPSKPSIDLIITSQ